MRKKKKIINDFERSSQTYFSEISKFSPLSKDEEQSLWEKYKKNNDIAARDKIVNSNLKFVASVAKGFQGMGLSYADLIAEGNYGLMKAMDRFDYEKGYKTISYSVWWIRQSILEALKERNSIKSDDLPQDFEKPIDSDDENPYISSEEINTEKFIDEPSTEASENNEIHKILSLLLPCLSEKEQIVIKNYFGCDGAKELTLEEIGKGMGLTKERVRQIKEKALKKLRSEALKKSITSDIYN